MIPKHEAERIRREAEAYGENNSEEVTKIELYSTYFDLAKGYEAGATAENLRYQPVMEALERIAKQPTISECKKMYGDTGDIDIGYDAIISVAREEVKRLNK